MQEVEVLTPKAWTQDVKRHLPYERIGSGALSLYSNQHSPLASALSYEILLSCISSRPKNQEGKAEFSMGLKEDEARIHLDDGKLFYLGYQPSESGLPGHFQFSKVETDCWIKPTLLNGLSVLIEAGKGEERCEFILRSSPEYVPSGSFQKEFYNSLKKAKWWGQDLLFQLYGGKEYELLKEKQKIELLNGGSILFVAVGDYLVFEEGNWKACQSIEASLSSPLARVKEIANGEMKWELWDEQGLSYPDIILPLEKGQKGGSRPEIFSSLRFHTSSQISCLIGKRRLILKKGDWLLKTAEGWHNLKNLKEIEDYLSYKLRGELFVFDSIDKQEDKIFMKGHFLDEMRTSASPIVIPISSEKKIKTVKKKRKALS